MESSNLAERPVQEHSAPQNAHKWMILGIVLTGVFMSTLDSSIVNVALPTIISEFGGDVSMAAWIVTAYILTIASTLLLFGRMGDIYGKGATQSAGFAIFAAGSLACALSFSVPQLIISRIFQALGGAMLMAIGPAAITNAFSPSERGKAFGLLGMAVAAGNITGPVLGGFLVQFLGWRYIFFVNVPIGFMGAVLAAMYISREKAYAPRGPFDSKGTVAFSLGIILLVFALDEGGNAGWFSLLTIGLFASSFAALALFAYIERKAAEPLLDPALFRIRLFVASNIGALVAFVTMMAALFLLPFYLSDVLLYSPQQMGLTLLPLPLTTILVSPLSGYLSDKIGSRILCTAGMSIVFFALLSCLALDASSTNVDVAMRLVAFGIGMGMFQSPNNTAIMNSVPKERYGIASGMVATMRTVGMSLGVASASAILMTTRGAYISQGMAQNDAFVSAMHNVILFVSAVSIIGIAASFMKGTQPNTAEGSGGGMGGGAMGRGGA